MSLALDVARTRAPASEDTSRKANIFAHCG